MGKGKGAAKRRKNRRTKIRLNLKTIKAIEKEQGTEIAPYLVSGDKINDK